jgi:pimeloyl-ACP methyl ester carboxylesterase
MSRPPAVSAIKRPDGAVAYDVEGEGPLIVCVPGLGELRSSYRFIAPMLRSGGYRVALMDLRGHGDSEAGFRSYGFEDTASDVRALIEELGGPAIIVGNSLAAASAVLVGAVRPDLVSGLVLLGPYVDDSDAPWLRRTLYKVSTVPPWGRVFWNFYQKGLYAGRKPADFAEYRAAVNAALKKPGHAAAFARTSGTQPRVATRALTSLQAPVLVVMGELNPDSLGPPSRAEWIAGQAGGRALIVPEAGHYPQAQRPDLVGPAIKAFADGLRGRA